MSRATLSSWPVAPGFAWIQTDDPGFARKLNKRSDTRLVATGVAGGFLRIFEMKRSPAFMQRLIARYEAANERFSDLGGPRQGTKRTGNMKGGRRRQQGNTAFCEL